MRVQFQFLIGSLKTAIQSAVYLSLIKFQFLIGSLKTLKGKRGSKIKNVFQFLIGSLKTPTLLLFAQELPSFNSL